MTADMDRFRQTLKDGVEGELESYTEDIAKSVVATLWNAVDDHCAKYLDHAREANEARNHYQRSAEHIAAKRDLAELVLTEWASGDLAPEAALRMIRSALAVGDVKTRSELEQAKAEASDA
jgi:hypothetical protein